MSDYIDRLEDELRRAGYRQSRRVPPFRLQVAASFAVVGVIAVLALALGRSGSVTERPVNPAAPPPAPAASDGRLPGPPPSLRDVRLSIADGTGDDALPPCLATQLLSARWAPPYRAPAERTPQLSTTTVKEWTVVYGTAPRERADLLARTLAIPRVVRAREGAFPELRSRALTIVIGRRPLQPDTAAAVAASFSMFGPSGQGSNFLDTSVGSMERVGLVSVGAGMCQYEFSKSGNSGSGSGSVGDARSGKMILTTEGGGRNAGKVFNALGIVPDGVTEVQLGDRTIPVRGNLWLSGPTKARKVEIPGIGTRPF